MLDERHLRSFNRYRFYAHKLLVAFAVLALCSANFFSNYLGLELQARKRITTIKQSVPCIYSATRCKKDCAINWLRIPKTATNMVHDVFMSPLLTTPGLFATTHLHENTCVMGPGDCSEYWGATVSKSFRFSPVSSSTIPPNYGISPRSDMTSNANRTALGRCFHQTNTNLNCLEYHASTRTMSFGPPNKVFWITKKELNMTVKEEEEEQIVSRVLMNRNNSYFISPVITGHVGLDISLFGWLLPPNPMVFSIFRDPVKRLVSSFHYGITYGADRPGHVRTCTLGLSPNAWRQKVTDARKAYSISGDSSLYQSLLRRYLTNCRNATSNVYTQFLDPLKKDLDVALQHLERHVIVGMQDNVVGSLKRWINVTLNACKDHPSHLLMSETLTSSVASKGMTRPSGTSSAIVQDSVVLLDPNMTELDEDLQIMMREYTREDEVIYKRAVELFHEQSHLD